MGDPDRVRRALAAIDAANADDPARIAVRGEMRPKELAHAELASEWLERLHPQPSDALRLAARAHHLRRWEIPRARYPEGRVGYLRWRRDLQDHHARVAGGILTAAGIDAATVARVGDLVRKKDLPRDPEVQALEDALCLVFLETQFAGLGERLEETKMLDVTRKTLAKMSPAAVECAAELPLDPAARSVLERALAGASG